MPDETETTETESAPSNTELAGRVDALDSKLDTILATLKGDRKPPEAPGTITPDAPTGVADEIRRQLEERDAKAASDKAAADTETWKANVEKTLGDLTEQKPEPPQRAVEKILWGRR